MCACGNSAVNPLLLFRCCCQETLLFNKTNCYKYLVALPTIIIAFNNLYLPRQRRPYTVLHVEHISLPTILLFFFFLNILASASFILVLYFFIINKCAKIDVCGCSGLMCLLINKLAVITRDVCAFIRIELSNSSGNTHSRRLLC